MRIGDGLDVEEPNPTFYFEFDLYCPYLALAPLVELSPVYREGDCSELYCTLKSCFLELILVISRMLPNSLFGFGVEIGVSALIYYCSNLSISSCLMLYTYILTWA